MTLTYENAICIRKSYEYLINKYNPYDFGITDICIIPADLERLPLFLEYYKNVPADESLQLTGYDPESVRLIVIREQSLTHPSFIMELDEYLTRAGIEKNYDQEPKNAM